MSTCQVNFETITGTQLTEAKNHFIMNRMNYSLGALKVCVYTVIEQKQTKLGSAAFVFCKIDSQYLMVRHIV